MGLIETEGIILKTHPIGDADKVVAVFTLKNGLLRGVAKGAKRLRSRFGGSLEPFSIVDMDLFQKDEKELVSIRRLELKKSFFEVAGEGKYFQMFSYLSDLLFEFIPANEANQRIYKMTCVCLETAVANPESLDALTLYFEGWLLKLSGYLPDWNTCNVCHLPIAKADDTGLLPNFQLICNQCRRQGNHFRIISTDRLLYAEMQKNSPAVFVGKWSDQIESVTKVSNIYKNIIQHITNKDLAAKRLQTAF